MATEDEAPADEGQGAHGPAAAGHGKHKGGLLNGPHREMIIMVASVVGVGLAYATLHRSSASGSSAAQTAAMGYPGSSGALSSGQVAGFDQSAVAGLQTQLANVSDQVSNLYSHGMPGGYGAGSAPAAPLASSLLDPTLSGTYVGYSGAGAVTGGNPGPGGGFFEVESDGSLLHLDMPQWLNVIKNNGGKEPGVTSYTGAAPGTIYNTATNLQGKINTAAGVKAGTP